MTPFPIPFQYTRDRRSPKRKGSAMILTLILSLSAGTAVLAMSGVLTSSSQQATRRMKEMKLRYSFEGVLAKVKSMLAAEALVPPATATIAVGGIEWSVKVEPNEATLPKTFMVTGTADAYGSRSTESAPVTNPGAIQAHHYVLASGAPIDLAFALNTGPSGEGSVYVDGTFKSSLLSTIDGDLVQTSLTAPVSTAVLGTTKVNARTLPVPTGNSADYLAAANRSLSSETLSGLTFSSAYETVYRAGNLRLNGQISGWGTVYISGDLRITGNTNYSYLAWASDSSCAVFVVAGDLIVDPTVTSFVGHFHVAGAARFNNLLPAELKSGSVYAANGLSIAAGVTMKFDPRIRDDELFGEALKVPGYWP